MSQIFNLKSKFLNSLNKTLQELTMKESITILKSPIMEADGNFTSVVQTVNNDFDKSKLDTSITVDEEDNKKVEEIKNKKKQLKDLVIDKIKQTLDVSDELQAILNDIDKLNKEDHSKEWVVNKEDNTATLNDKNMRIFKQNEKLCLSHNGKIEIFDSVEELHDWLIKNNVKLPEGIAIHESTETLLTELKKLVNKPEFDWPQIGRWNEIIKDPALVSDRELRNKTISKEEADKMLADQEEKDKSAMLSIKKMNKGETNRYLDSNPEEDPTKEIRVLNNFTVPQDECTTTASLGAPVQYTADKKLNEEEIINEGSVQQLLATALKELVRAVKGDPETCAKHLIQLYANVKTNPNYKNLETVLSNIKSFNDEETVKALNTYIDSLKSRDPQMITPNYLNAKETLIQNNPTELSNDTLNVLDSYYALPENERGRVLIAFGFRNDLLALERYLNTYKSAQDVSNNIDKIGSQNDEGAAFKSYLDNQGNNAFNLAWGAEIAKLDSTFNAPASVLKNVKRRNDYAQMSDQNAQNVEKAFQAVIDRVRQDYPEIPKLASLKDYKEIPTSLLKDKVSPTKKPYNGLADLYYWAGFKSGTVNPKMNTQTIDNRTPSREQRIAQQIRQNIESEQDDILNALNQNEKAARDVRYAYADLSELDNKDELVNKFVSNPKNSLLAKKGLLLRVLNNNIPLSAETLLNYANSLNVAISNDYKLLSPAEATAVLNKYKKSNLIDNIKNALEYGASQENIINKLKSEEKDVKNATASLILQDPKIDTDTMKDAWKDLLESVKDKSFKEKMKVLKEALFKEDETPEDFSSGISSNMNTSTSNTDLETSSTGNQDFNSNDTNTSNNQPPSFGDINIDAGGFDPDEYGPDVPDDDALGLPMPTEEFVIEDVLVNKEDKSDIKVKLKNIQTGEIVTKSLSEIDI